MDTHAHVKGGMNVVVIHNPARLEAVVGLFQSSAEATSWIERYSEKASAESFTFAIEELQDAYALLAQGGEQ